MFGLATGNRSEWPLGPADSGRYAGLEAILATVSVVHGELLGEPSAELRAKLAGSEFPHLFAPYQSM
jgi:hypothetical protein